MSRKTFLVLVSLLVVPGIGLLDQVSGDDLSLIVLYLVPILLASWHGGLWWGGATGVLAIGSWTVANIAFPIHVDIDPGFQRYWELAEKIIFFGLAAAAASRLRSFVDREANKSRTDFATGLPNRRAFASDLGSGLGEDPVDVGFIEFEGLGNLYLERGEASVEALLKAAAKLAGPAVRTYRFGDERLAFIRTGAAASGSLESMKKMAARIEEELLEPKALPLRVKIGIAHCKDSSAVSSPALRKFLEGSMIFLRGKAGTQVESFAFGSSLGQAG